jgi:hypothetical protein
MMPDTIGIRDEMAVLVSRQPLDWYALNNAISQNPGLDYAARLNAALGDKLIRNVPFKSSAKGNMQFTIQDTQGARDGVVATIIEISKK